MITCDYCKDQLLDYVFGLLEGSDLQETRAHLDGCAQCQASLTKVKSQQSLMTRAAKAIPVVAEFSLPSEQTAPLPDTLPLTPAPAARRPNWHRAWVGWSAAAAVMLALVSSLAYHRHTANGYEVELQARRLEHKAVAEQFAALPAKYDKQRLAAIEETRGNVGPHLHVLGPTTLQPGAKGHLRITTRHLEGTPAASELRVKLIDSQTKNTRVQRLQADREGHAFVEIDAGAARPGSALSLEVEAVTGQGVTRIEEAIRILEPTFVTRLDTNKIAYQVKDVLFYRVLVLDRYRLQPPGQPIAMRIELRDGKGKAVQALEAASGAGGVLAGEFPIDGKFQPGAYTLSVQPDDAGKHRVQPLVQRLEVVRDLPIRNLVRLYKDNYLPGDKVVGEFFAPAAPGKQGKIDGQSVQINSVPQPALAGGAGGGPKTPLPMAAPAAPSFRFETTIPPKVSPGPMVTLTIPVQDGKNKHEIQANIPIGPTDFTIDLFPEGGDLIAGVPNRVFYRVRSKSGQPVTGDGRVLLLTGKDAIPEADSSYDLGMGYLDFVPNVNNTYAIRIVTPTKIENLPVDFAALGIRRDGVVMQVVDGAGEPRAVARQGDPIRFTLRRQGPQGKLLVLAQCRGQIVDQRWVEFDKGAADVTLQPTHEAAGMIRVTAYELKDNALQPVAERLVYRGSTQRLDLGFELNTQQLQTGRTILGAATARDEKGQPAAAWLLASIIDERFQTRPRSLSAHFFLLNEVRAGADLDNAQLILHDSPESVQVLERFLGTHGWRRFVHADEPALQVKPGAAPAIFSRENRPLDAMRKDYQATLALVLMPIHADGQREAGALKDEGERLASAVNAAASRLAEFEMAPQLWGRLALGFALAVLLAASLLLMGVGTYRLIRAHQSATPAFGASFAALAGCILLVFAGSWLGQPGDIATPPMLAKGRFWIDVPAELDERFAKGPQFPPQGDNPDTGFFPLRATKGLDVVAKKDESAKKGDAASAKNATVPALRDHLANSFAKGTRGADLVSSDRTENKSAADGSPAWRQLMDRAKKGGEKKKGGPLPPVGPAKVKAIGGHEKEQLAESGRRFAYEAAPDLLTDTLLWHPSLWLEAGSAEVRFVIGAGDATYRVLLLGHSPTGRFGFYEKRLDVGR